jgi:hypothetical protein
MTQGSELTLLRPPQLTPVHITRIVISGSAAGSREVVGIALRDKRGERLLSKLVVFRMHAGVTSSSFAARAQAPVATGGAAA